MPVTPTSNPDVFRVSFTVAETGTGQYTGRHQAEIVCLLRLVPTGMEILYVHHLFRSRSGALGAFEEETPRRLDLTHSLIATIQSGVKEEFWSAFVTNVRGLKLSEEAIDLTHLFHEAEETIAVTVAAVESPKGKRK